MDMWLCVCVCTYSLVLMRFLRAWMTKRGTSRKRSLVGPVFIMRRKIGLSYDAGTTNREPSRRLTLLNTRIQRMRVFAHVYVLSAKSAWRDGAVTRAFYLCVFYLRCSRRRSVGFKKIRKFHAREQFLKKRKKNFSSPPLFLEFTTLHLIPLPQSYVRL